MVFPLSDDSVERELLVVLVVARLEPLLVPFVRKKERKKEGQTARKPERKTERKKERKKEGQTVRKPVRKKERKKYKKVRVKKHI